LVKLQLFFSFWGYTLVTACPANSGKLTIKALKSLFILLKETLRESRDFYSIIFVFVKPKPLFFFI